MTEKRFVEVITYTWSKDSHGLFDYENPTNLEKYFISTNNSPTNSKNIDLVVRALKKDGFPAGYEMRVGDIVKIGRVKFLVREIKDINNVIQKIRNVQEVNFIPIDMSTDLLEGEGNSEAHEYNKTEANCRICLMSNMYPDALDNTLVSPCKCKGSCEYVHLKCLKQWIDSKKSSIENSENICLSFNYKKLSCEICKENLPYALKLGPQEYDIINIKKPIDIPYIVLEKYETGRENKGLFLIKASEQEVRIGRGHTHQILVSDISVSRSHAFIQYREGKFLLFDNNSKFGTLVQVEQPIEISHEKTILQCGKTVIILSLKREEITVESENVAITEEQAMNGPQTPSTSNEQDIEARINNSGDVKVKKAERRAKKAQRRGLPVRIEETKNETNEFEVDVIEVDKEEISSKLVQGSKKIFKITRLERPIAKVIPEGGDKKERPKRGKKGQ